MKKILNKRLLSTACRAIGTMAVALTAAAQAAPASAQSADMIVVNAKIATLDRASHVVQAMAVRDGKVLAVGDTAAIQRLAGTGTKRIDAGGRTVIPGLIDSHMHAIRAGLTFSTEVNWIGANSIPEAMRRLHEAAAKGPAGSWLIVAGGWTEQQFAEHRRPTLQEVLAAVPDSPVYLQMLYSHILVTPKGLAAIGLPADAPPQGLALERDQAGQPTGWFTGDIVSITPVFDKLPRATAADYMTGTKLFFTELNRLGVTGVIDPGGFNLAPPQYESLFDLWRKKELTLRVAYSLFAQKPGTELADFQAETAMMPMGMGDDMLKFNGLGERVTFGMYNNYKPDEAAREKFLELLRWAARKQLAVTIHWQDGPSANLLLDLYEQVNREIPLAGLRWSIAHLDNAPADVFARMKTLGIGWTMQDSTYYGGDSMVAAGQAEALRHIPPIVTALRTGVVVGAGTDAHRVASYNPFIALQWMLDGRTAGGQPTRGADEIPTREQSLRMYTVGSAWFSFDDDKRGTLEPGKLADFAVLDRDFFTVPVERIGGTASLLTVVGGKPVYAAAPFVSP